MLKSSSRFYVFLLCIVISIFLWILVKLSGDYNNNAVYPIVINTRLDSKLLTYQSSKTVSISYRTEGIRSSFLDYFSAKKPLTISITKFKLEKIGIEYRALISLSDHIKQISDSLKVSDKNIKISPDTITLFFQDICKKKVPVHVNLTIDFDNQYELYEPIKFEPDSIVISGLKSDVDRVSQLETESKVLTKLNKSRYLNLKIARPKNAEKLTFIPDNIIAGIRVEKFTEGSINIPVTVINNKRQRSVKVFPDKVKVNYIVPLKDYNKVNPLMFVAAINFNELKQTDNNKIKVQIISYPEFTKILSVKPERVEFIIW